MRLQNIFYQPQQLIPDIMGFCGSMFKGLFGTLLFVINLISFFVGCAIIGFGVWLALEMKEYGGLLDDLKNTTDLQSKLAVPASIFIAVGVLVAITSFVGCCAVATENKCMMYSYAVIMTVLLIAEIAVVIVIMLYKEEADKVVKEAMKKGLETYSRDENLDKGWDEIQKQFKCCAMENAADWIDTHFQNKSQKTSETHFNAPDSCCKMVTEGCGQNKLRTGDDKLNFKGCLAKFNDFINGDLKIVGGVGIGMFVVQLIMIIAACYMGANMDK